MTRRRKKTMGFPLFLLLLLVGLIVAALGGGKQQVRTTSAGSSSTPKARSAVVQEIAVNPKETKQETRASYRYRTVFTEPQATTAHTIAPTLVPSRQPSVPPTATPAPTPTLRIVRMLADSEIYVWICEKGKKYHSNSTCSNMADPFRVTLETAKGKGYDPCKKCKPLK